MCLDAQGGIKAKRQPFCGWCCLEVMWSWTWSEKCVVVNTLSDVGTDNTYRCSGTLWSHAKLRMVLAVVCHQLLDGARRHQLHDQCHERERETDRS